MNAPPGRDRNRGGADRPSCSSGLGGRGRPGGGIACFESIDEDLLLPERKIDHHRGTVRGPLHGVAVLDGTEPEERRAGWASHVFMDLVDQRLTGVEPSQAILTLAVDRCMTYVLTRGVENRHRHEGQGLGGLCAGHLATDRPLSARAKSATAVPSSATSIGVPVVGSQPTPQATPS